MLIKIRYTMFSCELISSSYIIHEISLFFCNIDFFCIIKCSFLHNNNVSLNKKSRISCLSLRTSYCAVLKLHRPSCKTVGCSSWSFCRFSGRLCESPKRWHRWWLSGKWLTYSKNLNSIESLWDAPDRALCRRLPLPATLRDLKAALQEKLKLLDSTVIDNILKSMITRWTLCIQIRVLTYPFKVGFCCFCSIS